MDGSYTPFVRKVAAGSGLAGLFIIGAAALGSPRLGIAEIVGLFLIVVLVFVVWGGLLGFLTFVFQRTTLRTFRDDEEEKVYLRTDSSFYPDPEEVGPEEWPDMSRIIAAIERAPKTVTEESVPNRILRAPGERERAESRIIKEPKPDRDIWARVYQEPRDEVKEQRQEESEWAEMFRAL